MKFIRMISAGVLAAAGLFVDTSRWVPPSPQQQPPSSSRLLPPLAAPDPARLRLSSDFALVLDDSEGRILYEKGADTPTPIASLTKLMTAMVLLDGGQPLGEPLSITVDDVDALRGSASRLPVGWVLSRGELLCLALMCSDNRAAHALAREYPGGVAAFVGSMNRKAAGMGLRATRYADPTGLDSANVSTARELARIAAAASRYSLIRELTTTPGHTAVSLGSARARAFGNSDPLVHDRSWEIGLSKTGYIADSGFCLLLRANLRGRPTTVVLLRASGKLSRTADALRVRGWLESSSDLAHRPGKYPSTGAG